MGAFSRKLKKQMRDIDLESVLRQGQKLSDAKSINRSINKKEKMMQKAMGMSLIQEKHNNIQNNIYKNEYKDEYEKAKEAILHEAEISKNNMIENEDNTINITSTIENIEKD